MTMAPTSGSAVKSMSNAQHSVTTISSVSGFSKTVASTPGKDVICGYFKSSNFVSPKLYFDLSFSFFNCFVVRLRSSPENEFNYAASNSKNILGDVSNM